MTTGGRPLSPHMQIYRLPLLALVSVTHRATGMILAAGMILVAYWLGSAATGPEAFATASAFLASPVGLVLLFAFTVALFYHLTNGIRHLLWDVGWGFELPQAYASGYVVLAATAVLTVLTWAVGLSL